MSIRLPSLLLGLILIALGLVWGLQGLGLLKGSPMTGSHLWLVIGTVAVVVGIGLGYVGLGGRLRRA